MSVFMSFNKSNFTKASFFIFLFLGALNLLAQSDTIYVDENDRYVSKAIFFKKAKSKIYKGVEFSTDTVVLRKLRFNYYFGKLNEITKSQLFKFFKHRYSIDTTKTLVIHYLDTLKAMHEFPKKTEIIYKDGEGNIIKMPSNSGSTVFINDIVKVKSHKHIYNHNSFIDRYEKCIKNHKKYRETALILHFYNINNGHPETYKNVKWLKDKGGLIKKIFSDSYMNFKSIILHPNGEYYLGFKHKAPYRNLVKQLKWDKYKTDFLNEVAALNNNIK